MLCVVAVVVPFWALVCKGSWDKVPEYAVDGVVPPEMNRWTNRLTGGRGTTIRQKKGCFYTPDILPKMVFFIPLTVDFIAKVENPLIPNSKEGCGLGDIKLQPSPSKANGQQTVSS